MPGITLFVGGLPDDARERDVDDFFAKSKYGRVESIRVRRGFAFVDFANREDGEDCLRDLDGERLLGSRVRLDIANSSRGGGGRRSRSRDRGRGGGRDSGRPYRTKYTVEIDNLSSSVTWADLKDLFRRVGEVTYTDANQRLGRNRGEVCFADRSAMINARKEFDGHELNGRKMEVTVVGGSGARRSRSRSRGRSRSRSRSQSRSRSRSASRDKGSRKRSRSKEEKSKSKSRSRSASKSKSRSRSKSRKQSRSKSPKRSERKRKSSERSPRRSRDERKKSRSRSRSRRSSRR